MKKCGICGQPRQMIVQCPICETWFCGLCQDHKHNKEGKIVEFDDG